MDPPPKNFFGGAITKKEGGGEYQVPEIEIVDVMVEAGFATSTETGESTSGGWGMTDDSGDGEWE